MRQIIGELDELRIVEWLKDGSMLLSDDYNGAVYHITYGPRRQAGMGH